MVFRLNVHYPVKIVVGKPLEVIEVEARISGQGTKRCPLQPEQPEGLEEREKARVRSLGFELGHVKDIYCGSLNINCCTPYLSVKCLVESNKWSHITWLLFLWPPRVDRAVTGLRFGKAHVRRLAWQLNTVDVPFSLSLSLVLVNLRL